MNPSLLSCHPWQNTKLSFTYCIIRGLVSNTKGFESLDEIAWCLARVTNTSPLSPGSLVSFMSWTSHLPGGKLTKYYQNPFDTISPQPNPKQENHHWLCAGCLQVNGLNIFTKNYFKTSKWKLYLNPTWIRIVLCIVNHVHILPFF